MTESLTPVSSSGPRPDKFGLPWFSFVVFAMLIACALGGTWLFPHDPNGLNLRLSFMPPVWQGSGSWAYPLGTDNLGRDILTRIMAGCSVSLVVSLYAILLSGGFGTLIGMISGYSGGKIDILIMRVVDIQMSIPSLALALVLASVLGQGFQTVVVVIVITYWTWYARIVRGETISLRQRDYVAMAKVAGCGTATILRRHLLPNILNTLLVLATLQIAQVILFEATLSFLGLGIQPPDVSWGLMLADARSYITTAWWVITLPGLVIMATCLASNLLGDWLRDSFDPRRRQL